MIDISESGSSKVAAKNSNDNPPAYSMMNASTFSTASLLPAPQYCATRMLMPSVNAARHRLKMNWNCVASDIADSSSCPTPASINVSAQDESASISC